MPEVRFQVDDEFFSKLQQKLGGAKATEVARDALTLLNWAVDEKRSGNYIASAQSGSVVAKLAMPSLEKIAKV